MTLSKRKKELNKRKKTHYYRTSVFLSPKDRKIVEQLDNFSAFVRLCLSQAADIMAYDILIKSNPEKYTLNHKVEEEIDKFNKLNPTNELTELRNRKCRKNSPRLPEIW